MASRGTYVNFSTPHRRTGSVKNKPLRSQPSMDEVPENEEVLAYRSVALPWFPERGTKHVK